MTGTSRNRAGVVRVVTTLGGLAFALSLITVALAYLREFGVVPSPWRSPDGPEAVAINLFWFSLFALHHSVFARIRVRAFVSGLVSEELERSVYVWIASLLLALVVWQWAPVPGQAWHVTNVGAFLLWGVQLGGVGLTLYASHQLGVLQLAGMRQPAARSAQPVILRHTGLYGFVRHPIYFAWLLMVWAAPVMTGSRLTFAVMTTMYLVIAVPFEERTLRAQFGTAYGDYKRIVRWRMLPGVY